ncbi:hypothetical protein HK405_011403, partial [Cladochytrium tenue]
MISRQRPAPPLARAHLAAGAVVAAAAAAAAVVALGVAAPIAAVTALPAPPLSMPPSLLPPPSPVDAPATADRSHVPPILLQMQSPPPPPPPYSSPTATPGPMLLSGDSSLLGGRAVDGYDEAGAESYSVMPGGVANTQTRGTAGAFAAASAAAVAGTPADERSVGILLACLSSFLIGASFIFTKKGLLDATRSSGLFLGEMANFAAYSFAPAILVTPLGAGSVLVSAILANFFLDERLQRNGVLGCVLGVVGSVLIILNSPEERAVDSVDTILLYILQPGFLAYLIGAIGGSAYLIVVVAPIYGRSNMLVYIAICSLIGSVSVMACKGFAIALKLSLSGSNQLTRPITWVFGITVVLCALTQMTFLNKALELFSTNLVTPIYYVFFTSATISASAILFQGFNDAPAAQVASVLCGFVTIFVGVHLLNSGGSVGGPAATAAATLTAGSLGSAQASSASFSSAAAAAAAAQPSSAATLAAGGQGLPFHYAAAPATGSASRMHLQAARFKRSSSSSSSVASSDTDAAAAGGASPSTAPLLRPAAVPPTSSQHAVGAAAPPSRRRSQQQQQPPPPHRLRRPRLAASSPSAVATAGGLLAAAVGATLGGLEAVALIRGETLSHEALLGDGDDDDDDDGHYGGLDDDDENDGGGGDNAGDADNDGDSEYDGDAAAGSATASFPG